MSLQLSIHSAWGSTNIHLFHPMFDKIQCLGFDVLQGQHDSDIEDNSFLRFVAHRSNLSHTVHSFCLRCYRDRSTTRLNNSVTYAQSVKQITSINLPLQSVDHIDPISHHHGRCSCKEDNLSWWRFHNFQQRIYHNWVLQWSSRTRHKLPNRFYMSSDYYSHSLLNSRFQSIRDHKDKRSRDD